MKVLRYGWFGDGDLGEMMIRKILAGHKTATVSPAYDSKGADRAVGDELPLVDKHGNTRGAVLVTLVETRVYGSLDEELAIKTGLALFDLKEKLDFANGRRIKDDEEMRVVHFRLIKTAPPPRRPAG